MSIQEQIAAKTARILAQIAVDESTQATPEPLQDTDKAADGAARTVAASELMALADMAEESAADVLRDCAADCGEIVRISAADRIGADYNGGESYIENDCQNND